MRIDRHVSQPAQVVLAFVYAVVAICFMLALSGCGEPTPPNIGPNYCDTRGGLVRSYTVGAASHRVWHLYCADGAMGWKLA